MLLGGIILFSCNQSRLEYALEFAGNNREELEKVLTYYKDSGLKYNAACFLIENMPHYFSYEGRLLDSIKKAKTTAIPSCFISKEIRRRWYSFSYREMDKVYDSKVITSDYLIENIDLSFYVWRHSPWARHLTFEEFCEWILPYRIDNEPLENWRKAYWECYSSKLDSLYKGNDPVVAADSLCGLLRKESWSYNTDFDLPALGGLFFLKNRVGGCRESCDFTLYLFRALGFPVATDLYHYSPENRGGHLWTVLKDTTGKSVPFWFMETEVKRNVNDGRKKGKVYRMSFGRQPEKVKGMYQEYEVPSLLKNAYLKDVTSEYFGENKIEIKTEASVLNQYVYLGIFSPEGWIPIDIMKPAHNRLYVKDIEPGIIGVILTSKKGKLIPISYPFQWIDGNIRYFHPDDSLCDTCILLRKYPLRDYVIRYMSGVVDSKIEGANRLDFKDAELLYEIKEQPGINYNVVSCNSSREYRYIRYQAADNKRPEIAELFFYSTADDSRLIKAEAIDGSLPWGNMESDISKVCDNNCLTYFNGEDYGGYVTLDFGKPKSIDHLVYVPRNDENFVTIGDTYELFFSKGSEEWVSLGSKVADRPFLIYYNIPKNALCWLRNLSRGKEEQIFWVQDGQQLFLGK